MVNFFMEMAYFQFRLQVNLIVMLRTNPVFRFLEILTHHNNRRLNGSNAR